jgi:hypothetical protein
MKAEIILNHCARKMGVTPESIIKDIQAEMKVGTMQERIEAIVRIEMGVEVEHIKRRKRCRYSLIPRQLCVYLLRKHAKRLDYNWNKKNMVYEVIIRPLQAEIIAEMYNITHANVLRYCREIKNISQGKDRYTEIVNRIIEITEKQLG